MVVTEGAPHRDEVQVFAAGLSAAARCGEGQTTRSTKSVLMLCGQKIETD